MTCSVIRKRLSSELQPSRDLATHLVSCTACARFQERLDLARTVLADRGSAIEPDAGFAARVASRIARPIDVLGWAALRLLPAAMALAIALGTAARFNPATEALSAHSEPIDASASDDVLSWIADESGDEP